MGFCDNQLESPPRRPPFFLFLPHMQIKDVQWFCKAVEMTSLHRAADALGVTQPALTKAVRRLEAEIGARLLERTPRGVAPTFMGQALLKQGLALGRWVNDTQALLGDLKHGAAGELRIGVVPALVESLLTPVLAELLDEGRGMRFHVSVQLSDMLLRQLEGGELDFAIAAIHPDRPMPGLSCMALGAQRSQVVARRGHALFRRRFTVQDLAAQPWVLPPPNIALRTWVDAMFAEAGIGAVPAFVYTDATPAVFAQLVRRTPMLTVMTDDSLAAVGGQGLAALPAPAPVWTLQLGLFWRRSAYFSEAMERLRERIGRAFVQRRRLLAAHARVGPARRG